MDSVIIAAIISLLGVVLTAAISVYTLKNESKAKRVTEERIKWLNIVRSDFSIIMAAYNLKRAGNNNENEPRIDKTNYDNLMFEAEKAKYDFISRLNTNKFSGNEFNYVIKPILLKIEFLSKMSFLEGSETITENDIKQLIKFTNLMLEQEWSKSKKEIK